MSDLFSTLVTYGLNRQSQERSFQQQKELQQDAQAYNTLMWNKQNAYDSPMAQMQRFKSAGLNPNLIYGQMSSGSAPSISAGSAPSPAQAPAASLLETAQIGLLNAQKDNIQADTDEKRASAGQKEAETKNIAFEQAWKTAQQEIERQLAESNMKVADAQLENIREQTRQIGEEILSMGVERAIRELERDFLDKSFDDRLSMVKSELAKVDSEAAKNNAEANRITALLTEELNQLKASISEINSRRDLNDQERKNLIDQKTVEFYKNYYLHTAAYHAKNGQGYKIPGDLFKHKNLVQGIISFH